MIVYYLASGMFFGFAAGISPGPLLALVISETLSHGRRAGFLVSLAPIITDGPIIIVVFALLSRIAGSTVMLGIISLCGGFFLAYLSIHYLAARAGNSNVLREKPRSLRNAILTNVMNPHPYLFWMTIGVPMVHHALRFGIVSCAAFFVGFYLLLVGSKLLIAELVHRSKHFLKSWQYRFLIKITGLLLFLFSILFLKNGLHMVGLF